MPTEPKRRFTKTRLQGFGIVAFCCGSAALNWSVPWIAYSLLGCAGLLFALLVWGVLQP